MSGGPGGGADWRTRAAYHRPYRAPALVLSEPILVWPWDRAPREYRRVLPKASHYRARWLALVREEWTAWEACLPDGEGWGARVVEEVRDGVVVVGLATARVASAPTH